MNIFGFILGRGQFRRCIHRSHRLNIKCRRIFVYDGLCSKHINSCYRNCKKG